jgi:hypothetical protein
MRDDDEDGVWLEIRVSNILAHLADLIHGMSITSLGLGRHWQQIDRLHDDTRFVLRNHGMTSLFT